MHRNCKEKETKERRERSQSKEWVSEVTMSHAPGKDSLESLFMQRPAVKEVEGVPLLGGTAENWGLIWDFQAKPDDLVICTYPKAGTTWLQEIVDMVQHGGDAKICARASIGKRMPYLELCLKKPFPSGIEEAEAMTSPRTIKSHLPVQLLPPSFWKQNPKIIYMARNIKDSVVSYYHFHRMHKGLPDPGTWDQFLENFLAGKLAYGSWFDHVCGWWEAKDRHPILYLFYEDMKEDPAQEIQKVAQFLDIELSEPVLNRIVQHTSFESMKANPMANYSTAPAFMLDHSVSPFMRKDVVYKWRQTGGTSTRQQICYCTLDLQGESLRPEGTVGNWKDQFTVVQSEQLDVIYAQKMGNSNLTFRTQL